MTPSKWFEVVEGSRGCFRIDLSRFFWIEDGRIQQHYEIGDNPTWNSCSLDTAFDYDKGQPDAPAPGPEQKQFEKWVGNWNYEGDIKVRPLGSLEQTQWNNEMPAYPWRLCPSEQLERGLWLGGAGDSFVPIPGSKRYRFHSYDSAGNTVEGFERMNGAVWQGSFTIIDSKGLSHRARTELRFGADGNSMTAKWEVLNDGEWGQLMDIRFTKSKLIVESSPARKTVLVLAVSARTSATRGGSGAEQETVEIETVSGWFSAVVHPTKVGC